MNNSEDSDMNERYDCISETKSLDISQRHTTRKVQEQTQHYAFQLKIFFFPLNMPTGTNNLHIEILECLS